MTTEIRIDPNVRVEGNLTYAGYEDLLNVTEPPNPGEVVRVRETESGLAGWATVDRIDPLTKLVYLCVDWATLRQETSSPLLLTFAVDRALQQFVMRTVTQPPKLYWTDTSSKVAVAAQKQTAAAPSPSVTPAVTYAT